MCVFISWYAYVEVGLLCAKYFEEPPACFYYSRGNTFFWSVDSHPFENVALPLRWRHPRADEQGNVWLCAHRKLWYSDLEKGNVLHSTVHSPEA